jgi:hypothetical protein
MPASFFPSAAGLLLGCDALGEVWQDECLFLGAHRLASEGFQLASEQGLVYGFENLCNRMVLTLLLCTNMVAIGLSSLEQHGV